MKIIKAILMVILGGLVFFLGFMIGSPVASLLGLPRPPQPSGVTTNQLLLLTLLTSVILAAALAFISRRLAGGFLTRWLVLAFFTWIAYGVNTYFEASIFTTLSSPAIIVMYFFSSLFCAAVVGAYFRPQERGEGFIARTKSFFKGRTALQWTWRLLIACLAFPVAYILFGLMVKPFTYEYYAQHQAGLLAPGWGQIIPVLAVRSLLFLLAILPVLIAWTGSRTGLFVTLGVALFLLVGGLSLLEAIWYPPIIRVAHSLEILADSFAQAAVTVFLLVKPDKSQKGENQSS